MDDEKPLAGIKVADFSMVYAGPICARMLGDNGADVIKIEPLGMGDTIRANTRIFSHFNAGKKSIQIDLSQDQGRSLAIKLIEDSDILIENFRPGIMARFGLDYDTLKSRYPQLIYCSISGFGQSGPNSQRAAYAPIAHAASGYDVSHMRAQLKNDSRPPASGIMIADMLTGAYAFGAIQTALIAKLRSGKGDHIDITMLESTMMLIPGQQQSAQKIDAPWIGGFQPIATKDGFLMLCIVSDKNMKGLCEAIDRPDLLQDERFVRGKRLLHMSDFIGEVEKWSNLRKLGECEDRFDEHGVPYSRYNAPEQLFAEPQLRHRGAFREMVDEDGDYLIQNPPFQFQSFDNRASQSCATAGEHTDSILKSQAKLKQAEIDKLRRDGIIE